MTPKESVQRWRRGQAAAARAQRVLMASKGADPEQAVAEALAALNALADMGLWPAPKSRASERGIAAVRRRWARIEKRARAARTR